MKILKSAFKFQPADNLLPTDKFKQIIDFIKVTANLKRRFVMITTPDILTALGLVMRLEPVGNMMWQTRFEGNQFQIIPDIFHPMNKPGYILIRYVDADTVTLIEFEEHMMGVVGFDNIVCKQETEQEFNEHYANELSQIDEETVKQLDDFLPEDEQEVKDPREFQIAEQVGDKFVFDPEICRPSTETCGQCIHGVCCEKAKKAKASQIAHSLSKDVEKSEMDAEKKKFPMWVRAAEEVELLLNKIGIKFTSSDSSSSWQINFKANCQNYQINFDLAGESLANWVRVARVDGVVNPVIYTDRVDNDRALLDLEQFIVGLSMGIVGLDQKQTTEVDKAGTSNMLDDTNIPSNGDKQHKEITEEEVVEELAKELPSKGQPEENEEIPLWKNPIERIEKDLCNYRIEYKREDNGNCHYLRYETNRHEYCLYFENREVLVGSYHAVFSVNQIGEGKVLWAGLISSNNRLRELERVIVENIKYGD